MEQLLGKLKERRDMAGAQMVAGAVRTRFLSQPDQVLSALATWTEHSDKFVRIAAGLALGTVSVRNPEVLPTVMPYVERLANDQDAEVRRTGAVGALELIWVYHYDEVWVVMEDWIDRKNDLVRRATVETMGQIVKGGKIGRPSTLKQFIDRGMQIIDRLLLTGSPDLRDSLAGTVNEFGLKAPDLIAPWIKEWSSRSDLNSLTLARDVLEMPFGRHCRGIDRKGILARVAGMESEMVRQISGWVREGKGRVEYFTIFADHVLTPVDPEERPGQYWADPYRGCQFRCEFCAARDISEYAGRSEEEFVRRVIVVANAAEVLAREIAQMQDRGDPGLVVHIGRSSDPFQPAEDKFQITREMLKILVGREVPVVVHTRSETVLRDLDVLERLAERNLVNVRIAIPTPIEGIRKKLELGVPSVTERLRVIGLLTRKNIPVGLTVSPIIPQLTDHVDPLDELIRRAADAGASFVVPEVLNLTGSARPKFRHFIETFLPSLAQVYEEIYPEESEGLHVDPDYVRRLTETVVPGIAEKYGANRTDLMLGRPVAAPTAG